MVWPGPWLVIVTVLLGRACVEMVFVMVPPGIVTVSVYLHKGQNRQICGTGRLTSLTVVVDWYSDSVSTSNVAYISIQE